MVAVSHGIEEPRSAGGIALFRPPGQNLKAFRQQGPVFFSLQEPAGHFPGTGPQLCVIGGAGASGPFPQGGQQGVLIIINKEEYVGAFQRGVPADFHPRGEPFRYGVLGGPGQETGIAFPVILFQIQGEDQPPAAGVERGGPFYIDAAPAGRGKALPKIGRHGLVYIPDTAVPVIIQVDFGQNDIEG
jgi:hypothetical protein